MMDKEELLLRLNKVEHLGTGSKLVRLLHHPLHYGYAFYFRKWIYSRNKKEKEFVCPTFFGIQMHVLLPSSTDIYLTGGKAHMSEIKLARFLIHHLNEGDTFLDVGAHYGYFSMLASKLVGQKGSVISFEASPTTFRILQKNALLTDNVTVYNNVVSNQPQDMVFYEFPNLYAEYNSLYVEQFEDTSWFALNKPEKRIVKAEILDHFLETKGVKPTIIKIDVEGAEFQVIKGLKDYLTNSAPIIAMEYLSEGRGNEAHQLAEIYLKELNYNAYNLDVQGKLVRCHSISNFLESKDLDSDNILFLKKGTSITG